MEQTEHSEMGKTFLYGIKDAIKGEVRLGDGTDGWSFMFVVGRF